MAPTDDTSENNKLFAANSFEWALRELTANLIRVSRGAGKPYDILNQSNDLVLKAIAYKDSHGYFPSSADVSNWLSLDNRPGYDISEYRAQVRGAMQMAASMLMDQNTQFHAGESELFEALQHRK